MSHPAVGLRALAAAATLLLVGGLAASSPAGPNPKAETLRVPGTDVVVRLFEAPDHLGVLVPHYQIREGRGDFSRPRATSYEIKLRHGTFDPLADAAPPAIEPGFAADSDTNLYVVQFATQPLDAYRDAVRDLGGKVSWYLPRHSHVVRMSPEAADAVAALPFVRWVGDYHPAYRLEPGLLRFAAQGDPMQSALTCNVMLLESDDQDKADVAAAIEALGGKVERVRAGKFLLRATLTAEQLAQVARFDEVLYIDPWGPLEKDMDISRELSGANYVETVAGFTGQGVRAEVFDAGFNTGHLDFQSRPLLVHGAAGSDSHGAATSGIVFGDGAGNPAARGVLPDGQGIVSNYDGYLGEPTRYDHTGELPQSPYYGVFQTSSVGSPRTFFYTTISADNDAALFDFDVLHLQSQSNAGNQDSRPQAWAKNVLSGGGVRHYNTADKSDDCWCGGASIGPASDGRIKPDLCHFYDDTLTTTTGGPTAYTTSFGGTSGATPNIAGYTGLFFQMWSEGIFGNDVVPGGTVFDNRCHMTTAKAAMINTAEQYPFSGTGHDLTRVHQGWGMPNVANLYDLRDKLFFVDETDVIGNLQSTLYVFSVGPGEAEFKATLVFADPPGNPAAAEHRINDLSLKVTAPDGTIYWGNQGLLANNYSTPGGASNTIDTVENVFVQSPQVGTWLVEVIADEIIEDGHVETPELDADYALVVSAVSPVLDAGYVRLDRTGYVCGADAEVTLSDAGLNLDPGAIETTTVTIVSDTEPAGEILLLTESAEDTGFFSGSILLSPTDGGGVLHVSEGDTVIVTYIDADDGLGGMNVVVTDEATVDCTLPTIQDVAVASAGSLDAWITFTTDEATRGSVRYGTDCGALTELATQAGYDTDHAVHLVDLVPETTYFFAVDAEDVAGNAATDDNGGACYTFETPPAPLHFSQQFTSAFDLDGTTLILRPADTNDGYTICVEAAAGLPTDPAGGSALPLSDDDFEFVNPVGDLTFYGATFDGLYVGSNGFITFDTGDSDYTETLEDHFSQLRISALFDDLNPSNGGTVSWKELADRVAVTWSGVPEYSNTGSNTFQVELFFDGAIHVTWAGVTSSDSVVGISAGNGMPSPFLVMDLSDSGPCPPPCPTDLDGDGETGFGDLVALLAAWGQDPQSVAGDLNGDGEIGFADLVMILSAWGDC